jgi:hypothetical protein
MTITKSGRWLCARLLANILAPKQNFHILLHVPAMKLSVSRYVTLITVQTLLLVVDISINAFSDLALTDTIVALVVFV